MVKPKNSRVFLFSIIFFFFKNIFYLLHAMFFSNNKKSIFWYNEGIDNLGVVR